MLLATILIHCCLLLLVVPLGVSHDPATDPLPVPPPQLLLGQLAEVGFVINLSRRSDRFEDLLREGRRVGLEIVNNPTATQHHSQRTHPQAASAASAAPIALERWDAFDEIDHVDAKLLKEWKRNDGQPAPPGQIGCALSHFTALREAKRRGLSSVLLLEDDILFLASNRTDFAQQLQDIVLKVAAVDSDWEMLQLGSSRCHPAHRTQGSKRIVAVAEECWLGHAVVFREPGITKALELWPTMKLPADSFYVWLQEQQRLTSLVVVPPLINQRIGHSDLTSNRGLLHITPLYAPLLEGLHRRHLPACIRRHPVLEEMQQGLQFVERGLPFQAVSVFRKARFKQLHPVSTFPSSQPPQSQPTAACTYIFNTSCNHELDIVVLQLTVLLAETLRQISVEHQDPTGVHASEAKQLFQSILEEWQDFEPAPSREAKANRNGMCSRISSDMVSALVAMANVGVGMILTWQTRVEEAMVCFGKATWAAPSSGAVRKRQLQSSAGENMLLSAAELGWCAAANFQHGINVGMVAAVWLFFGSKDAAQLLQTRASMLLGNGTQLCSATNHSTTGIQNTTPSVSESFTVAWSCANVGMLNMMDRSLSLEKRILFFSQSIETYDMLLHSARVERSRVPLAQTILGLADVVAVGWMDYRKAKDLSEQAVEILMTPNKKSRLIAATLVKCKDRVKMFTKLLNAVDKPNENHARIVYLTADRTMVADMFVGDVGTIYLSQS